jgi:hypothetical protein
LTRAPRDLELPTKETQLVNTDHTTPGSLTLVATPIGNLSDISERSAEQLRSADCIACEDTRVTGKLLSKLNIAKSGILLSYREENEKQMATELADRMGVAAYQVDLAEEIDRDWVAQADRIGVTAGASAPESLVRAVIDQLAAWGAQRPDLSGSYTEDVVFSMPRDLLRAIPKRGEIKSVVESS